MGICVGQASFTKGYLDITHDAGFAQPHEQIEVASNKFTYVCHSNNRVQCEVKRSPQVEIVGSLDSSG